MPKTKQTEAKAKKEKLAASHKKTAAKSSLKKTSPVPKPKKKELPEGQKIRIKIKAYDHRLIDESAKKIIESTLRQGANICGPVPLPTETHKWTVNRSTFVHKDARDQYEMRVYKRIIDIVNPSAKIIDSLSRLDLPAGIDIEIKY